MKLSRLLKYTGFGLVVLGLIYLFIINQNLSRTYKFSSFWLWNFISGNSNEVRQNQNSVNMVIFGIGGENHAGADLTDTILVVNLNLSDNKTVFISVPRDIWISSIKDKINAAYNFGEAAQKGKGLLTAKAAVEEVLGIPVHYGILIDFSGFVKIVDLVGGIDVVVSESFTDELYPIAGKENDECGGDPQYKCRYETISFNKGTEHMDGSRALKYVRSRHAGGVIGTDISRGQRQQTVLLALKDKLINTRMLQTKTVREIWQTIQDTIVTDLPVGDALMYGRIYLKTKAQNLQLGLNYESPENETTGLLINPPVWQYDGLWVLVPKAEDFSEIHKYINCSVKEFRDCRELIR